jgi:hypothetical protein
LRQTQLNLRVVGSSVSHARNPPRTRSDTDQTPDSIGRVIECENCGQRKLEPLGPGTCGTGFIGGIPRNSFNAVAVDAIILAYFISASVWRRLRPRSKFALEYARRAYRLAAWTLTVVVATIAPPVYALLPFLGKAGDLFQNIVFVIGLGVFLSLLGLIMGLADTFKQSEDEVVKKFEAGNSTRPK